MYTKGQWEITQTIKGFETSIECDGMRVCEVKHFDSFTKDPEYEEGFANAKLIAAAPDMLEALMNLENDNNSIPDHVWNMVKYAIKKATGK